MTFQNPSEGVPLAVDCIIKITYSVGQEANPKVKQDLLSCLPFQLASLKTASRDELNVLFAVTLSAS